MSKEHYIMLFLIGVTAAVLGGVIVIYMKEKEIFKFNKQKQ